MTKHYLLLALAPGLLMGCVATAPSIADGGADAAVRDSGPAMVSAHGGVEFTYTDGVVVGGLAEGPQSRPAFVWAVFEPEPGLCPRLQAGGIHLRADRLTVLVRGADDQEMFLPPTDGAYPVRPGQPNFEFPQEQAMISLVYSSGGGPSEVSLYGASGVVRLREVGSDSARVEIDATLEDGTVVSGAMLLPACPDIPPPWSM